MGPNDRSSSRMTILGIPLDDWNEVTDGDTIVGSNHEVVGGTEHYNEDGDYTGFTDDDGVNYNADGEEDPDIDFYATAD